MKLDPKKIEIQQKYRDAMEQKKDKKKHFKEAIFIVTFIVLIFILNGFGGNSSRVEGSKQSSIEAQWMYVAPEMDEVLKKMNDQYTGIAIDVNPKPIKYYVKTSLEKPDGNLNEMIQVTNEIIKFNNLPSLLKENETYEIIVRGSNQTELERKVFN
jgi:hypothetical protein